MRKVYDGTPDHSATSMCHTCNSCQHVKGTLLNEEMTLCHTRGNSPPVRITWRVTFCNDYEDKRLPSMWQMEKIAWKVSVDGKRKFVGFMTPKAWKEKGNDPDD